MLMPSGLLQTAYAKFGTIVSASLARIEPSLEKMGFALQSAAFAALGISLQENALTVSKDTTYNTEAVSFHLQILLSQPI